MAKSKPVVSLQTKMAAGPGMGKLKKISEWLFDATKAFEKVGFVKEIGQALPWVGAVGESLAEAAPPIKFVVTLFTKLTEELDPNSLGYMACTVAYQRAAEQAFAAVGEPEKPKKATEAAAGGLQAVGPAEDTDFKTFSFRNALEHTFVKEADKVLVAAAESVGYSEAQQRKLVGEVHVRFVGALKTILSHGKTREKFAPFTSRMSLGTPEEQAYAALFDHVDYQRRQFEEDPVFRKEPFALAHVYVDVDCGKLTWGEISKPAAARRQAAEPTETIDPFSEKHGGRQALIETVLGYLGDRTFKDAIVVQGVAGSGKSTFTLALCAELLHHGLRPIRVRMKDLRLDVHVKDALPEAVRLADEDADRSGGPDNLFLDGAIFNDSIRFGETSICPWVIILDGWDEVSVSVAEGFKIRIDRLLEQIRSEYVDPSGSRVRVILTGRPSTAVTESKFLRAQTPILTVRPWSASQLNTFVEKMAGAQKNKPVATPTSEIDLGALDLGRFEPVLGQYKKDWQKGGGTTEVLGLPLLAHLAVRLMAVWPGDLSQLVQSPTTLYRSLVDLTCEKAGKAADDPDDPGRTYKISGDELRRLLRETAAAMTVFGRESISFKELALRLNEQDEELIKKAGEANDEHILTALMVAFFFKGGHRHLGAEFMHKSFREYLFAEQVVETIKQYGRIAPARALAERALYWEDFPEGDPRRKFSRALAQLFSPVWLTPEVDQRIRDLLEWEIQRAGMAMKPASSKSSRPTPALDLAGWERARDGLADLWDWWGEGVHLRPPIKRNKHGSWEYEKPIVSELIEWAAPLDLSGGPPIPARTTSLDAHLGDALFQIAATVHYHVARAKGWLAPGPDGKPVTSEQAWAGFEKKNAPRRYQRVINSERENWIVFAPSGENVEYFANYISRINAAGWRPKGAFPTERDLSGVCLRQARLPLVHDEVVRHPVWQRANLESAKLRGADMYGANLSRARLLGANLTHADMYGANLIGTQLSGAQLGGADLTNADLTDADLTNAEMHGTDLAGAKLIRTDLTGADLGGADLIAANLTDAKLAGADLTGANLTRVIVARSQLDLAEGEWVGTPRWIDEATAPVSTTVKPKTTEPAADQTSR